MELSLPEHATSSSQIWPLPGPNRAFAGALTAPGNPSWRQTTRASFISQESSQTVPQMLLWYTSTLPSQLPDPPTSLRPKVQENKGKWNVKCISGVLFCLFVCLFVFTCGLRIAQGTSWFPLTRFCLRTLTLVNFHHVNKIKARYKVLRLNVKLSEVQLLRLRATVHALPLPYLPT